MSQTVPAGVELGPAYTGLAVGYRVLTLARSVFSAFSTGGVVESTVLGTYVKVNGVIAPDAGGYIVWGISGTDYAEADILPATSVTVSSGPPDGSGGSSGGSGGTIMMPS